MFSRGGRATEVFHNWAHQVENRHGRVAGQRSDSRVFYEGRSFYSFGRHYVAAYLAEHDGRTVALFNTRKYSPTTSGHVSAARSAASHLAERGVPDLTSLVDSYSYRWDRENGRPTIEGAKNHVRDKLAEYDAAGATFVLEWAGMAPLAALKLWNKLRDAAERAAALKAKQDAATHKSVMIGRAKRVAALSDAEFARLLADKVAELEKGWPRRTATEAHKDVYNWLNEILLVVNKTPFKRIAAKIRDRKREVKALTAGAERRAALAAKHRVTREAIAAVRLVARKTVTMPTREELRAARRGAGLLAGLPMVRAETSYKLGRIGDQIQAALDIQALQDLRDKHAKEAERRAAWLAGHGRDGYGLTDATGAALVRATGVTRDDAGAIVGGTLETSQGANVPLTHAVKAFLFVKRCREAGKAWSRNGVTVRVGHYQVDRIEADGSFQAGCHRFSWAEIARLAAELGVFDAPASDSAVVPSGMAHA